MWASDSVWESEAHDITKSATNFLSDIGEILGSKK